MDQFLPYIIPFGIGAIIIILFLIVFKTMYKVADVDKALIVTGGKKPLIKISGGAFVIPVFRKYDYFDLSMLTVTASNDEIMTSTSVPIEINWTAQIRPDISSMENLLKAIISFKERGKDAIISDTRMTLMGGVRDVVAAMTPEGVLKEKAVFASKVKDLIKDEMLNMGMELVSLNIQDINDNNGYYNNIAELDMQDKRREAESKKAKVDQAIRTQNAESEREASQNELQSELAIAEKTRDNKLKMAEYKAETDKADADAAVAGQLQKTIRAQEIAQQEGRVEVVKQEQANLAALKEQEVIATKAESDKKKKRIEAEADANVQTIGAEAKVKVAENEASAIKIQANAQAEKTKTEGDAVAAVTRKKGEAQADVIKQQGLADAEVARQKGLAQAEVTKQQGLAEAEVEKQKLMAQAEGERALAEARASNDKVNFEIEKLKIETEGKVQVATQAAQLMGSVGSKAEFVNIGGSQTGGSGNVLVDTLSSIPALMRTLNAENEALNGKPFNAELKDLVSSVLDPAKGILATNVTTPAGVPSGESVAKNPALPSETDNS